MSQLLQFIGGQHYVQQVVGEKRPPRCDSGLRWPVLVPRASRPSGRCRPLWRILHPSALGKTSRARRRHCTLLRKLNTTFNIYAAATPSRPWRAIRCDSVRIELMGVDMHVNPTVNRTRKLCRVSYLRSKKHISFKKFHRSNHSPDFRKDLGFSVFRTWESWDNYVSSREALLRRQNLWQSVSEPAKSNFIWYTLRDSIKKRERERDL